VKVGYGKIGRSMPLTLEKCGNLGGDVEMVAVIKELALRHPEHEFVLIGRNSGDNPADIGLPSNITNPWIEWAPELRRALKSRGFTGNFTTDEHLEIAEITDSIVGDVFDGLDQLVLWIGQHGTTNTPMPFVQKNKPAGLTKPQDAFAYYSGYLLRGINRLRDRDPLAIEPVFLNADSRNYLKMRDMAWPLRHPVLTQRTYSHKIRHERGSRSLTVDTAAFPDARVITKNGHSLWESIVLNHYSRLEVNGLRPGTPFGDLISFDDGWDGRQHFGLFINEARSYVGEDVKRINVMRDWVLPIEPAWVHGTWSEESKQELGINIQPAPWDQYYPRLHSVRSTFTTPSSGSGFATAKPWEAFAAGTVCFFHPRYDDQNNILADAPDGLANWLRVSTPEQLTKRVEHLNTSAGRGDWEWIVRKQREHFDRALSDLMYLQLIEERIFS
jgi:hypothetical protein